MQKVVAEAYESTYDKQQKKDMQQAIDDGLHPWIAKSVYLFVKNILRPFLRLLHKVGYFLASDRGD